jgi:hydroxymethylpyrimidine/phosphomethylpyrimidine kinase
MLADGESGEVLVLEAPRIETVHTHGTGCTLASAIACGLARKQPLAEAVRRAHAYVQAAIRTAPGLGAGHGPLNHFVRP